MHPVLQEKLDTVSSGTQMLKRDLFMVEQSHAWDDRTIEEKALAKLISRVIKLEFDVTTLMADYVNISFRYPVGQASDILDELWTVFLVLDEMFLELKVLTKDNAGLCIHPAELKRLQGTWIRLNKFTKQARQRLREVRLLSNSEKRVVH